MTGPAVNWRAYYDAHADVRAEYERARSTADPKSPAFTEKGLDSPEAFAQRHWLEHGQAEGRTPPPGISAPLSLAGLQLGTVAAVAGLAVVGLIVAARA